MLIRGCVSTDVGKKREKSTDAAILKVASSGRYGRVGFAVLCDGLEDADGAGEASTIVADRLAAWFQEELPGMVQDAEMRVRMASDGASKARVLTEVLSADDVKKSFACRVFDEVQTPVCARLEEIAEELNVRIAGYGRLHGKRMGTTTSCLLILGGEYLLMRIGPARAFLTHGGDLKHLCAYSGDSYEPVAPSFGVRRQVAPVFVRGTLSRGTGFLLCSDGFFRRQDERILKRKVGGIIGASERRMESALKSLTRFVRRQGEDTDAFAVYVSMP